MNRTSVTIVFDGGTPCNIPRLGYGIGYGSYRIDNLPIVRVNHGRPMSANAAEILTLVRAVQDLIARTNHPPAGLMARNNVDLTIIGDSQIALKWAAGKTPRGKPAKMSKKTSPEFQNAVQTLRDILRGFENVRTIWKARANSVAIFGH